MRSRKELADAIRILSMDAVDKAKSGHPGAPMGMADMAEALWRGVLRHNPADPHWANRDRFVLSNGHASMLLYSVLHLTGYDLSMDDIKNFRQLGSRTPGHPEKGVTPGVETTTGPLGQGFATAVGMAVAEKLLAAEFNRDGFPIVDHHTYVFLGDGCLMEGLSQEACSLAGTLGLGKLIVMYDDNGISIDGDVHQWFGDDTPARFEACGWHVISGVDGHDAAMLDAALVLARKETERPTLICCKTTIGYGSPKKGGTASSHGSPMGADENAAVRAALGWKDEPFVMPQDIKDAWDARERGAALEGEWKALFAAYAKAYPDLAAEFERRMSGTLPADWESVSSSAIARFDADKPKVATRIANRDVLNAIAPHLPELFGGSADLTGSVGTWHEKASRIGRNDWNGNYLSYGVREFVMGTVMNGLALHGGFIPYGGTFLVFSDYARNAIRLSALMKQRLVWVLTHDSIGVGEDGPTHQPVEHVSSLRLIPELLVWRPCDAVETAVAWKVALESAQPSCMVLTRQGLTPQTRTEEQLEAVKRGAYILKDCEGTPEVILIATGSEVQLAVSAAEALAGKGRKARVVSMPCAELFDAQPAEYKENVLPRAVRARVAVEAASVDGWWKYVGLDGAVIGMSGFGFWSHDIGGHHQGEKDDELYLRWVQLGVFSPIMRLHSTSNPFMGKEPWNYRWDVYALSKEYLRLRHRLIPYLYTMNWRTHSEGRALCEPMYYEWPEHAEAYTVPNEFLFGSELIVAPITQPVDSKTNLAGVRGTIKKAVEWNKRIVAAFGRAVQIDTCSYRRFL